jgi:hypothetical protein
LVWSSGHGGGSHISIAQYELKLVLDLKPQRVAWAGSGCSSQKGGIPLDRLPGSGFYLAEQGWTDFELLLRGW